MGWREGVQERVNSHLEGDGCKRGAYERLLFGVARELQTLSCMAAADELARGTRDEKTIQDACEKEVHHASAVVNRFMEHEMELHLRGMRVVMNSEAAKMMMGPVEGREEAP